MEVAEAACIAHGLLDHMHGLIHGLAPLVLALRGHIYSTTSTKVKTRLEVIHKHGKLPNWSIQMTQSSHVLSSIYTLVIFQPCRLKLNFTSA